MFPLYFFKIPPTFFLTNNLLFTGKVSFMSRIFGTTDRLETKELRVNAVEQRIQEGKINMKAIVDELK